MSESYENKQETKKASNRFLKGTLVLTIAGLIVKVIGSLNWIILSRVLGGEGIGLYLMAFPLYLLALSVSSAGIPVAISIITAEKVAIQDYRGANRVFNLSLIVLAITGLFFALLLFFGAGWLIEHRFIRDARAYYSLVALSPAIFFVTILSSFRGYLQGWQIMTPTAISQIVEQLFRVAAMLFFASLFLSKGLEFAAGGASLGAGAGAVAGLIVLIYYYWKVQKNIKNRQNEIVLPNQDSNTGIIKRIAALALPVSLASIMLPAVSNLDLLIVPARLEVAGYTVEQATELFGYLTGMAVPLVNLSTILTAALATSLVPAISEACALGSPKQVYLQVSAAMRISNLVTLPGFIVLLLLAEPVATLIYNAPQATQAVRILSVAVFLLGIHQVTTGALQGMGHTTIPVINMGISAVVKVALNWVLTAIPSLGIMGAAWATVADIGVAALLNMYYVHRYTGFSLELKVLIKNVAAAAVMGIGTYIVYGELMVVTHSNVIATLTAITVGMASYGIVLILTGAMEERDIARIPMVGKFMVALAHKFGMMK